jgi:hypothetical protein
MNFEFPNLNKIKHLIYLHDIKSPLEDYHELTDLWVTTLKIIPPQFHILSINKCIGFITLSRMFGRNILVYFVLFCFQISLLILHFLLYPFLLPPSNDNQQISKPSCIPKHVERRIALSSSPSGSTPFTVHVVTGLLRGAGGQHPLLLGWR